MMECMSSILRINMTLDSNVKNGGFKQGKRDNDTLSDSSATDATKSPKLTLSNNLKASMVVNFNCSESEANKLWSNIVQNSSVN